MEMNLQRLAQIKLMLEESPNDAFLLFALAQETQKTGQVEEAIEIYKTITTTTPDYVGTYYHLGKLQEAQEEYENAKKTYQIGIEKRKKKEHPTICGSSFRL